MPWHNTFAGVFGGALSYAIGGIKGSRSTWKCIFIIYGAATVLVGAVMLVALPDSPSKAWFFNEEEGRLAVVRLASSPTGVETRKKKTDLGQILEAFRDPRSYCIWANALGYAVANAGITNFDPLIISGYGFLPTRKTLMATPQAAVAMIAGTVLTTISLFRPSLRCVFWIVSALIGLAGAAMSSNTAGATRRSFMGVSVDVMYASANIIGLQLLLAGQAPTYVLGIAAMTFAFALMAASGAVYLVLCAVENKRRDSLYGPAGVSVTEVAGEADDETDVQNKRFRYTY